MKETIKRIDENTEYFMEERCFILELHNALDDPAVSIARARVKPGVTTRLHRLHGIAERYVILEGTGRVEVGTMPPQDVQPGDVVLIPAFSPQRITNTGDVDLTFLAICTPRFTSAAYENIDEV